MRTSLDTNILSAIWSGEPGASNLSNQLQVLRNTGTLAIAPIVFAELFAHPHATQDIMGEFMTDTAIEVDFHLDKSVWIEAGLRYSQYAARRRKSIREAPRRLLADFLVGAHALVHADQLMTLDTNRFTHDFPELRLVDTSVL
ncbi:type II toxin-antitoxin system VapC family toxin [Granulicella aggregans]|uniref:type II toxin-antitoxin system VapC family toxin n=1 Tax=Granulicella aggregans TaxID=474949 RepID=UPI0021E09CB2|nr:type II toxin-antitoxin system VapC family toxin [Granulicella aggregans]